MVVKLIILIAVVWIGLRFYQAMQKRSAQKPTQIKVQDMVSCGKCGIHIPANEALKSGDQYFCSQDHLPEK